MFLSKHCSVMDRPPDPGLARLRRYALAVWCWRARSRIGCSPTKYAMPQWASRCRSDSGRAERRMSGDRARKPPGCVRVVLGFPLPRPAGGGLMSAMLNSKCALLLFAFWLLTSCTSASSPSLHRVTELIPGISTRDDAIAKLGSPSNTSKIGDQTVLQWADVNSSVHLAISFGIDGRMIQVASDAMGLDQLSATRR